MNYLDSISTPIRVRPNDLDSLGHVNNAVVLEYFELGRWQWLTHYHLRQSDQVVPVVARVEVDYHHEIQPGELMLVTRLEETDFSFSYQVHFDQTLQQQQNGQTKVVARGDVKVAFLDARTRTLCSVQAFVDENIPQENMTSEKNHAFVGNG